MDHLLQFKLGKNFGVLLSEISRDHIIAKNDPETAYKVFSTSGAPPEHALDLLSGKEVIKVDSDEKSCYIVDYNSLSSEEKNLYPKPISWNDWANKEVTKSLNQGLFLIGRIKYSLFKEGSQKLETFSEELFKEIYNIPDEVDLGYYWRGYCLLSTKDILSLWTRRDLLEREGIKVDILDLLSSFDTFLQSTSTLVPCVSWIYEQYGGGSKSELSALQSLSYSGNVLLSLISEYKTNEDRIKNILSVYKTVEIEDDSDDIITKHLNKNKVLEEELEYLKPVDITKGWDAGYISPSGKVYALCGDSCQLLHLQLADRIHELYGWTKPKENIDWELDRRGWIKFHSGECLYAGYNVNPEIPITTAQKAELIRYAKSQGSIKCGYNKKVVTENDLLGQPEDYYENLFS